MVDLGNWFGESYVLSRPIDPEADAEAVVDLMAKAGQADRSAAPHTREENR